MSSIKQIAYILLAGAFLVAFTADEAHAQLDARKDPAGTIRLPELSDPFAGSILAYPIVLGSAASLTTGILYKRDLIPSFMRRWLKHLTKFDISSWSAFAILAASLSIYAGYSVTELDQREFGDFDNVEHNTATFVDGISDGVISLREVKYFLLYVSLYLFDNIRFIPFLASMALLILVYLLTATITKRKLAGIAAFFVLIQSPLFLEFDTSATYDYSWITLYVLSLYLALKRRWWYFSPVAFLFSLFSKPLTAAFLPLVIFLVWRSEISSRSKIILMATYGLLLAMMVVVIGLSMEEIVELQSDASLLVGMISTLPTYLHSEYVFWITLLPMYGSLFVLGRNRTIHGQSVLLLVGGTMISYFVLEGFTSISAQPYRLVPLIVMGAVGLGMIFTRDRSLENKILPRWQKIIPFLVLAVVTPPAALSLAYILFPTYMTGVINRLIPVVGSLMNT